jgi:hypothetical protein
MPSQTLHACPHRAGYREPVVFPSAGLIIGVAERYEIVCDFGKFPGQTLYLFNDRDPKRFKNVPYFCFSRLLAKIIVGPAGAPARTTLVQMWQNVLHAGVAFRVRHCMPHPAQWDHGSGVHNRQWWLQRAAPGGSGSPQ